MSEQGSAKRAKFFPNLQSLTGIFRQYPEIQAVYLFGSAAEGKMHAESDLDLAIYTGGPDLTSKKLELYADLARDGFDRVDLIFLDSTTDIVLKYEAVRLNKIIYQTGDFDSGTLYSLIIRMYLDFLPYLDIQREAYKRRILSGQG